MYGSSLEEASISLLLERFVEAETAGQGRRSDIAAALLLEACRMGLHRHVPDLLNRTRKLIAEDSQFPSLISATESILILHISREPLEAHSLEGLDEMAEQAYLRACYLIPGLAATADVDENDVIESLIACSQIPSQLGNQPEHSQLLWNQLYDLVHVNGGNAVVLGAACGLLFDDGQMPPAELVEYLHGYLISRIEESQQGVSFLRGLLRTARSVLWQVPEVVETVTGVLSDWSEDEFIEQLPNMRLAFSDLTPRECNRVAHEVSEHLGGVNIDTNRNRDFSEYEMLVALEVNRRVLESLKQDGLEAFVDG
jgi:hypothetical protein